MAAKVGLDRAPDPGSGLVAQAPKGMALDFQKHQIRVDFKNTKGNGS
jgi:hypothetical protein